MYLLIFSRMPRIVYFIVCACKMLVDFHRGFIYGYFANLGELKSNLSLQGGKPHLQLKSCWIYVCCWQERPANHCPWCGYACLYILGTADSQIYSCFTNWDVENCFCFILEKTLFLILFQNDCADSESERCFILIDSHFCSKSCGFSLRNIDIMSWKEP